MPSKTYHEILSAKGLDSQFVGDGFRMPSDVFRCYKTSGLVEPVIAHPCRRRLPTTALFDPFGQIREVLRAAGANGIYDILFMDRFSQIHMKGSPSQMHLHVACGIIERDGLVLAARRNASSKRLPLKWEFPGGKIDRGESAEACVKRELLEEMGVSVDIKAALPPNTHRYSNFSVTLYPFICTIVSGEPALNEHAAIRWLSPEDLYSLDWAEADYPVLDSYLARLRGRQHETL